MLADAGIYADALAARARAAGAAVTVVPHGPLGAAGYAPWIGAAASGGGGSLSVVVDLRSVGLGAEEGAAPAEALASCDGALQLVRAVLEAGAAPRMWWATRGAQPVVPGPLALAQAPLWGLARVVSLEEPALWGGLVDLDPVGAPEDQAARLCAELTDGGAEDHVGFRADGRYVLRVADSAAVPAAAPSLAPEGAYLVTGGLGGVLQQVARWLVARGARRLVLTSRRGLAGASQQQLDFVAELQVTIITPR